MALTNQRKMFIKEYLVDLNATKAAIRAGYSAKTANEIGPNMLTIPEVKEAIQKEMKKREHRTEITADKVLAEYAKVGMSDVTDYLTVETERVLVDYTAEGEPISEVKQFVLLKDTDSIPKDKLAAISEIKQAKDGSISFKLHDKVRALDSIGKHLGMFIDKHEITGAGGGPIETIKALTDEELDAKIKALLTKQDQP